VKIAVTYGETRSKDFNNHRAEASIEVDVEVTTPEGIANAFMQAWQTVKDEVKLTLNQEDRAEEERWRRPLGENEIPF
jgi:hypothetical protein